MGSLSYVFITESRKVKRNEENAKIAPTALTTWYQAYYDIWLRGQYVWRIKEMHAQYGTPSSGGSFGILIESPNSQARSFELIPTRSTSMTPTLSTRCTQVLARFVINASLRADKWHVSPGMLDRVTEPFLMLGGNRNVINGRNNAS